MCLVRAIIIYYVEICSRAYAPKKHYIIKFLFNISYNTQFLCLIRLDVFQFCALCSKPSVIILHRNKNYIIEHNPLYETGFERNINPVLSLCEKKFSQKSSTNNAIFRCQKFELILNIF